MARRLVFGAVAEVVADLVRDAQFRSERCQRGQFVVTGSGNDRAQRRCQGKERSRLLRNHGEIVRLRTNVVMRIELFELPDAAQLCSFAECLDAAGEDFVRQHSPHVAHRGEGPEDQQVADDEGATSTCRDMKCGHASPLRRTVDDVVVHERRKMKELDRDRRGYERRSWSSERRPRAEDERCAEQLGLTDHGCHLLTAAPECNVPQPFTTCGKLRPITVEWDGADQSAEFVVDQLPLSHHPQGWQGGHTGVKPDVEEREVPLSRRGRVSASIALERGMRFVLADQGHDGLWRDFLTPAGEASEWPTGFIATALQLAGAEARALERAAETLVANQNDDGGWGYNEAVPSDADSTACVLLFLVLMGHRGTTCRRAASCLVMHQHRENGGIATYFEPGPIRRFMGVGRWMRFDGWCRPHTEVTATAGRALMALEPNDCSDKRKLAWEIKAASRYARSRQRADGSWSSYWWTSPHYTTLQAVELALALGDHDSVGRAAEWALRTQVDDGGWSAPGAGASAFATALSLSVLLHAGASRQPVERAISRLVALQDEDGGWPSHPIMRIPLPGDVDPDRRRRPRLVDLGRGITVRDQHRTFTSAACVAALARAREAH